MSKSSPFGAIHAVRRLPEGTGSDVTDVVASETDIVESLVGKAAKLGDGTAIAEPVLGKTERVHRGVLRGSGRSSVASHERTYTRE